MKALANHKVHVKPLLKEAGTSGTNKCGGYQNFTVKEKAKIAKQAAEMGVGNSTRNFQKELADCPLKGRTIRMWINQYRRQLKLKKRE